MEIKSEIKKTFPFHGILGIVILFLSEISLFKKVNPFYSWFYCFSWWSYILIIDGIIYYFKRNSLIINRKKEFLLMIPWSICIWLIFEAANFSLQNWYYINLPRSIFERWTGYAIAYGTVLPGLFETTEFLETLGIFKNTKCKKIKMGSKKLVFLFILGIICLIVSILIPLYFFSLIWVGFIFLLDPLNYRFGNRSLLRQIEGGSPRKIYCLLLAGFICGFLWEFWNFWALSKWIYTVPFFEDLKGFEMPFLGFLGFPPFTLEVYVIYEFISLFRFGRGWEGSTYKLNSEKKLRLTTKILTLIMMISFSIFIFNNIDKKTVDSYYTGLKDAYWIEPHYQKKLEKAGILSLEDLVLKTREKTERDELALRIIVSKEELNRWIQIAQLVLLKGIGTENFKLLEKIGIDSISALAQEDPEMLYQKIKKLKNVKTTPKKAKIKIWIKEAKKSFRFNF